MEPPMDAKAIGFRSRWSPVEMRDVAVATRLSSSQLLVGVSFVAINPVDVKTRSFALLPYVHTAGKEFSGVVEAVGAAASGWKVGDRICGLRDSPRAGSLGTKAIVDVNRHTLMKSPDGLSDGQAAAFPLTFGTALDMLERTGKRGRLLVLGAGSNVGSYAIQLARRKFEFTEVVATCSHRSAEFVAAIGADTIIDYETTDNLSERFRSLHTKFDAILDTVGGYDALRVWPDILKSHDEGGVYVSIAGDCSPTSYKQGLVRPLLPSLPWMVPRLLLGRYLGINYQFIVKKSDAWTREAAVFFAANAEFQIRIARVFGLHECGAAWKYVEDIQGSGKVLVNMRQLA